MKQRRQVASMTRLPSTAGKRERVRRTLEVLGKPVLFSSLWFTKLYRPGFHTTSPVLHQVADRVGVYPLIDHYHEPMVMPRRHGKGAVPGPRRDLPGLDLNVDTQLALLAELSFQDELKAIPQAYSDMTSPYYDNGAFPPGDAQTLHNLIRRFRPQRIIEVGSGESTRFAAAAVRINGQGRLTCIEPFEAPWLGQLGVTVHRSKVEDADPGQFGDLAENDILFIDSSHVVRPGGDVLYLFNQVLPSLASGVLVHVHDIFTPRDYPPDWIARRYLWDEQYVLEALLTKNSSLEVVLALNLLHHEHRDALRAACPAAPSDHREPRSLWLRVRG